MSFSVNILSFHFLAALPIKITFFWSVWRGAGW